MSTRASRTLLTTLLLVLIGVLVLQALAYGINFVVDPEGGVAEFGPDAPTDPDDVTVALVGLVGLAMVGVAGLLVGAGWSILRGRSGGTLIAMVVGAFYVLVGVNAVRADWWWDAGFYLVTGVGLIVLGWLVRQQRADNQVNTTE